MCTACLMNEIKSNMLGRRELLLGAAAAGTVASAAAAPTPVLAQGFNRIHDLTHVTTPDFPTFSGKKQYSLSPVLTWAKNKVNRNQIQIDEHTGTHIDAPFHFSEDGKTVEQIDINELVVNLCVVDIRAKAQDDADAQVTPEDLKEWIASNGDIPENSCVAMLSGWESRIGGDGYRNIGADDKRHFPGFHVDAARMLMEESGTVGIAVDTLSLDHGASPDFATHYAWLPSGRWGLECVANLADMPSVGATMIAAAPKLEGATGGPTRVLALI